ncbi:hypothetical protein FOA52_011753 [Chlamydomonas sp. UWO 241]|nr:hypothetical protein FOA52_011753 [Chlamydomonas sp. UWO 241]
MLHVQVDLIVGLRELYNQETVELTVGLRERYNQEPVYGMTVSADLLNETVVPRPPPVLQDWCETPAQYAARLIDQFVDFVVQSRRPEATSSVSKSIEGISAADGLARMLVTPGVRIAIRAHATPEEFEPASCSLTEYAVTNELCQFVGLELERTTAVCVRCVDAGTGVGVAGFVVKAYDVTDCLPEDIEHIPGPDIGPSLFEIAQREGMIDVELEEVTGRVVIPRGRAPFHVSTTVGEIGEIGSRALARAGRVIKIVVSSAPEDYLLPHYAAPSDPHSNARLVYCYHGVQELVFQCPRKPRIAVTATDACTLEPVLGARFRVYVRRLTVPYVPEGQETWATDARTAAAAVAADAADALAEDTRLRAAGLPVPSRLADEGYGAAYEGPTQGGLPSLTGATQVYWDGSLVPTDDSAPNGTASSGRLNGTGGEFGAASLNERVLDLVAGMAVTRGGGAAGARAPRGPAGPEARASGALLAMPEDSAGGGCVGALVDTGTSGFAYEPSEAGTSTGGMPVGVPRLPALGALPEFDAEDDAQWAALPSAVPEDDTAGGAWSMSGTMSSMQQHQQRPSSASARLGPGGVQRSTSGKSALVATPGRHLISSASNASGSFGAARGALVTSAWSDRRDGSAGRIGGTDRRDGGRSELGSSASFGAATGAVAWADQQDAGCGEHLREEGVAQLWYDSFTGYPGTDAMRLDTGVEVRVEMDPTWPYVAVAQSRVAIIEGIADPVAVGTFFLARSTKASDLWVDRDTVMHTFWSGDTDHSGSPVPAMPPHPLARLQPDGVPGTLFPVPGGPYVRMLVPGVGTDAAREMEAAGGAAAWAARARAKAGDFDAKSALQYDDDDEGYLDALRAAAWEHMRLSDSNFMPVDKTRLLSLLLKWGAFPHIVGGFCKGCFGDSPPPDFVPVKFTSRGVISGVSPSKTASCCAHAGDPGHVHGSGHSHNRSGSDGGQGGDGARTATTKAGGTKPFKSQFLLSGDTALSAPWILETSQWATQRKDTVPPHLRATMTDKFARTHTIVGRTEAEYCRSPFFTWYLPDGSAVHVGLNDALYRDVLPLLDSVASSVEAMDDHMERVRAHNASQKVHGRFLFGHEFVDSCAGGVFVLDVSAASPAGGPAFCLKQIAQTLDFWAAAAASGGVEPPRFNVVLAAGGGLQILHPRDALLPVTPGPCLDKLTRWFDRTVAEMDVAARGFDYVSVLRAALHLSGCAVPVVLVAGGLMPMGPGAVGVVTRELAAVLYKAQLACESSGRPLPHILTTELLPMPSLNDTRGSPSRAAGARSGGGGATGASAAAGGWGEDEDEAVVAVDPGAGADIFMRLQDACVSRRMRLVDVFRETDKDGDNALNDKELLRLVERLVPGAGPAHVRYLQLMLDVSADKKVTYKQLSVVVKAATQGGIAMTLSGTLHSHMILQRIAVVMLLRSLTIKDVFSKYDHDRDGYWNHTEQWNALKDLFPGLTVVEQKALFAEMQALDVNGDGRLSLDEFNRAMAGGSAVAISGWGVAGTSADGGPGAGALSEAEAMAAARAQGFPLAGVLADVAHTARGSHRRLDLGRAQASCERIDEAPLHALVDYLHHSLAALVEFERGYGARLSQQREDGAGARAMRAREAAGPQGEGASPSPARPRVRPRTAPQRSKSASRLPVVATPSSAAASTSAGLRAGAVESLLKAPGPGGSLSPRLPRPGGRGTSATTASASPSPAQLMARQGSAGSLRSWGGSHPGSAGSAAGARGGSMPASASAAAAAGDVNAPRREYVPPAFARLSGTAAGGGSARPRSAPPRRESPRPASAAPSAPPRAARVVSSLVMEFEGVALQGRSRRSLTVVAASVMSSNDIRNGTNIQIDGVPYKVIEFLHVKPGKGSAFVRSKLKNFINGSVVEKTFRAGETLEGADVNRRESMYTYTEGEEYVFMDQESFEETRLTKDSEWADFLKEGTVCELMFYNGKVISVDPPGQVELEVVDCPPNVKGNTASGQGSKAATLETGAIISVPAFIDNGQKIRVDTKTRAYVSKVN